MVLDGVCEQVLQRSSRQSQAEKSIVYVGIEGGEGFPSRPITHNGVTAGDDEAHRPTEDIANDCGRLVKRHAARKQQTCFW